MGAVSLIAERFFPVSERSTATALMAEANSFGLAAAFLVGPNMITSSNNVHQLLHFYILCSVLIGLNLVAALCYYPPHPPTPPTKSAQAQQTAESKMTLRLFMVALWRLAQNRQFWVLCVSYGMTTGIYGAVRRKRGELRASCTACHTHPPYASPIAVGVCALDEFGCGQSALHSSRRGMDGLQCDSLCEYLQITSMRTRSSVTRRPASSPPPALPHALDDRETSGE